MNARSICTAVIFLIGSVACDGTNTGTASNASMLRDAGASKSDSQHDQGGNTASSSKDASTSGDNSDNSGDSNDSSGDSNNSGNNKNSKSSKDSKTSKSKDKSKSKSNSSDNTSMDQDAGVENAQPVEPADYSKADNWLCRPGHNARCETDLDTTIVNADGSTKLEPYEAEVDPDIDCFYVYPTVSLDKTANSDLKPGPEEDAVVRAQFARFGSRCRLFAPMYRQVTLTALRASLSGKTPVAVDRALGYNDVAAAFKYYLDHDNMGRPFVLIGHSQGSGVLTQLIKQELDKAPADSRFLTAILAGTNVLVPKGKTSGGTFKNIPLCESEDQLGCIIVYASFRETSPPPANSLFATSSDPALVAACTNPANLGSTDSAEADAYLSTNGPGVSSKKMGAWAKGVTVDTPFVSVPGLLSAQCKFAKSGSYLAIGVHADPNDPRTDDIVGDVISGGKVSTEWGLHLIDVHLVMGNLLDVVLAKTLAYQAK